MPTYPKFNIKVIGTYRDALSRQVAEAVRIDLRGDDNRDDWWFKTEPTTVIANPKAEDNPEGFPAEGGSFQDELGELALWRLGTKKKAVKRKKEKEVKAENILGGRKKKKARLERLENWGEAENESETDVRA